MIGGPQRNESFSREGAAIVGIGRSGEQEFDRQAAPAEEADCGGSIEHTLVAQHTRDERNRDGRGFGIG